MKRQEKLCLVLLGLCLNVKEFSWSIFKFNPCCTLPARYRLMIDKLIPSYAETLEVQPVTGHERLHSEAEIHSGTSHLWACSPPQAFLRRLILRRASHDFMYKTEYLRQQRLSANVLAGNAKRYGHGSLQSPEMYCVNRNEKAFNFKDL